MSTTSASNTQMIKTLPKGELAKIATATIIGTTIEWYDYFIYAMAAGLVFPTLFFAKDMPPGVAALVSFATTGISFLFRPLGAFLAGHFGDRIGRRAMLVTTLLLMGISTTLIGVLPTYAAVGAAAPVLLIILRILQGVSAGGEWGGAALMAVEASPTRQRGLFGSFPQIGVPIGQLLASGVIALMTGVITPDAGDPDGAWMSWGWRIPFFVSVLLIIVGFFARRALDESPVFQALKARGNRVRVPIARAFARYWWVIIFAALVFAGNNGPGYMTTGGFLQTYASKTMANPISVTAAQVGIIIASVVWLASTLLAGWLADKIGRKTIYLIGAVITFVALFPLFPLIQTSSAGLFALATGIYSIGLGLTYGPIAAFFAELFPSEVRYTGISIAYAIGAIVGGAFAPLIAQALVQATGTTWSVVVYLAIVVVVGAVGAILLRDRRGIPLDTEDEQLQEKGLGIWQKPVWPQA